MSVFNYHILCYSLFINNNLLLVSFVSLRLVFLLFTRKTVWIFDLLRYGIIFFFRSEVGGGGGVFYVVFFSGEGMFGFLGFFFGSDVWFSGSFMHRPLSQVC